MTRILAVPGSRVRAVAADITIEVLDDRGIRVAVETIRLGDASEAERAAARHDEAMAAEEADAEWREAMDDAQDEDPAWAYRWRARHPPRWYWAGGSGL